jgi:hypothetical protein
VQGLAIEKKEELGVDLSPKKRKRRRLTDLVVKPLKTFPLILQVVDFIRLLQTAV